MRYGFNEENRIYTLEEVGQIFNITRERVRQIETKAIYKIKLYTKRHKLSKELNFYI